MSEQLKKMSVRELVECAADSKDAGISEATRKYEAIITEIESRCGGSQPDSPKVPEGCVMLHGGDAPKVPEPHPVTRQRGELIGLKWHDGHWYRLAGWGQPGNWSSKLVFVPTQHAELLLAASTREAALSAKSGETGGES